MNIGVIKKDGVINTGGVQRFHHFPGTGCAAGVQQKPFGIIWQLKLRAVNFGHYLCLIRLRNNDARRYQENASLITLVAGARNSLLRREKR